MADCPYCGKALLKNATICIYCLKTVEPAAEPKPKAASSQNLDNDVIVRSSVKSIGGSGGQNIKGSVVQRAEIVKDRSSGDQKMENDVVLRSAVKSVGGKGDQSIKGSVVQHADVVKEGAQGDQNLDDSVLLRSTVRSSGGSGDQSVKGSVVQHSDIVKEGTNGDQAVEDSTILRSTITSTTSSNIEGGSLNQADAAKAFRTLRDDMAKVQRQEIKGSVIQNSVITQINNITMRFESKGIEFLVCSNPKCRNRLKLKEDELHADDIKAADLTCPICHTHTRLNEAIENGYRYFEAQNKRIGDVLSKIASGDVKDAKIRSYVFQRDIVDYLAEKFLKSCQFVNPVLSSPYAVVEPVSDKFEHGTTHDEFIETIISDSKLPSNPYITQLAGTEEDLMEAKRQAAKLRVMAFMIDGLLKFKALCEAVRQNTIVFPNSCVEAEKAELEFNAALSTCKEASEMLGTSETFFEDLTLMARSLKNAVKCFRLQPLGKDFTPVFEKCAAEINELSRPGRMELDQSKLSTVFMDPGKDRVKKRAEDSLRAAANTNAGMLHAWAQTISAMPSTIRNINNRLRDTFLNYTKATHTKTNFRIAQVGVGIGFGIFLLYFLLLITGEIHITAQMRGDLQPEEFCIVHLVVLITLFITTMALGGHAAKHENNRQQLAGFYSSTLANEINAVRNSLNTIVLNSTQYVNHFTASITNFQNFWALTLGNKQYLMGAESQSIMGQLANMNIDMAPYRSEVPKNLFAAHRYRDPDDYTRDLTDFIASQYAPR